MVSHLRSLAGRVLFVPNCLRAERKNVPHLLQKSVGLVFGEQTQTRRGLQDHGGPVPLLLRHGLLGDLQQLPDGVATLQDQGI